METRPTRRVVNWRWLQEKQVISCLFLYPPLNKKKKKKKTDTNEKSDPLSFVIFVSGSLPCLSRRDTFALFHFAKITISSPGKKLHPSLLFVRKIFNIKKKKILEKLSALLHACSGSRRFILFLSLVSLPPLCIIEITRWEGKRVLENKKKKKKRKRTRLSFVTLLSLGYFEGPLVCGVVALNGDLDSLSEVGCCKFSDRELFFGPRITCWENFPRN